MRQHCACFTVNEANPHATAKLAAFNSDDVGTQMALAHSFLSDQLPVVAIPAMHARQQGCIGKES